MSLKFLEEAYCECCGTDLGKKNHPDDLMGYHLSGLCFRCWDGCPEDFNEGKVAHGCIPDKDGDPGCIPGLDAHAGGCEQLASALEAEVGP